MTAQIQPAAFQNDVPVVARQATPWGRFGGMLWAMLFCICLIYVYIAWLSPHYAYMGFPLKEGEHPALWYALALTLLSAWLLPGRLLRFSDFFLWMLFYFVYAPSMLIIPLQGLLPDDGFVLVTAIALSYQAMRLMANYQIRVRPVNLNRTTLLQVLLVLYIILNVCVFAVYGGRLKLVGFDDVYDQRAAAAELTAGSLVGYASGVLAGAFNPFFIAVGLTEPRKRWLWLGIAGQIFLYATAAMKFVLLSALMTPVFYYFWFNRSRISSARLGILVAISCTAPMLLIPVLTETPEGVSWQIVSLVFMRTYGMAGALTGVYADFFSSHPFTYYSHINLVSLLLPYPYELSLGEEVGWFMVGAPLNANANFWASDGIAAAGVIGVVFVGIIVGLFLILANSVIKPKNRRFAFTVFIPFIITICNSSFFTCLLTGGGGLLLLLTYLWQAAGQHAQRTCTLATVP